MNPLDRPVLAEAWELALDGGRALVRRRHDSQPVAALTAFEAIVLALADGERTWQSLLSLLAASRGPEAPEAAEQVAGRLQALLTSGVRRTSPVDLESLAAALPPSRTSGLRARPGPQVLHWWVTSSCPRRCVYCFAEPTLSARAPDATLPRERLHELFLEARSLGGESLLVAGAEPLLRPDLPEVMGDAIASGIEPVLTTKHRISRPLAERLARAGVRHLSFSLDAVDEPTNAKLIGAPSYARQVAASIERLREVGIEFSIQAVVTAVAPRAYEQVVELAARAGARVVQVVPYEAVRRPIARFTNAELKLQPAIELAERLAELGRRYAPLKVELFEQLGSGDRASYQCDIGMTKLFFLADGTVHRCYKLRSDGRLRGRSLLDSSLAAAWHDPGFVEVISPPRREYAGSACADCGGFETCHADGRCIYQAAMDHGRYTAPDRQCGRSSAARPAGHRLPVVA